LKNKPIIINQSGHLVGSEQGDQIGRIFAQWTIVYFGQFFDNYKSGQHFYASFFLSIDYVLILTKKRVGLHFARFLQAHLVTLVASIK
jgi:hypothetical protein